MRGKIYGIKLKMLVALLLPVCLMIAIGLTAYEKAYDSIVQTFTESVEQSVSMTSDYINFGLDKVKLTAMDYLVDDQVTQYFQNKMDESAATTYQTNMQNSFVSKVQTDSFINGIYIFGDEAYSISTSQNSLTDLYSQFSKGAQGQKVAADEYSWMGYSEELDTALGIDGNQYILRLAKKFYKNNICVALDIDKNAVVDIMQELDFGEGSVVSFITEDGREISKEGVMEQAISGTEFYNMATQNTLESGYIENVSYQNNRYMFLFARVKDANAFICVLVPNNIIFARVAVIKYILIVLVAIATIVSILVGLMIVFGIDKSINKLIGTVEKLATGNFGVTVEKMPNDELGTLNQHVGNMITGVKKLIMQVDTLEGDVIVSLNQINHASEQFSNTSQDIRKSVNMISQSFERQAESAENCSNVMNGLSDEIREVLDYTQIVNEVAAETGKSIDESQNQMHELQERSRESIQMNMEVVATINELNDNIGSIENIIETVTQIASKTKLLALNASIEAARAGELGKGFNVVAQEVGDLANQSTQSTANINEIVSKVRSGILSAVETSAKAKDVIGLQEQSLSNSAEGFEEMKKNIDDLVDKFEQITDKVSHMEIEKTASMESIKQITGVVNANVDAMQEVVTKINEQADMAIDMKQLTEDSRIKMKSMEDSINQFKI